MFIIIGVSVFLFSDNSFRIFFFKQKTAYYMRISDWSSDVCSSDLFKFGVQFVRFINHRDLLGWDRLIASLEAHQTELPKRFFDLGPGRGQRLLTKIIADAVASGQVETDDAAYAADALPGPWLGLVNLEIKTVAR